MGELFNTCRSTTHSLMQAGHLGAKSVNDFPRQGGEGRKPPSRNATSLGAFGTPPPPAVPLVRIEGLQIMRAPTFYQFRLVTWMQKTLMLSLDEAVREAALWELDKPREEWLFGYPAELALLAGQV